MSKTITISIPRRFFEDHEDRGLATPNVLRASSRKVIVSADDPALPELLDDAQHYATPGLFPESDMLGLVSSARATVRAIKSATRETA